jgi:hypothetical protein
MVQPLLFKDDALPNLGPTQFLMVTSYPFFGDERQALFNLVDVQIFQSILQIIMVHCCAGINLFGR